jgi:hypothetical protein
MIHSTQERSLADRIQRRIEVEKSFARARRTYRKNRVELWCDRHLVPRLLKLGLQATGLYARGLENALHPAVRTLCFDFDYLPAALPLSRSSANRSQTRQA